LLTADIRWSIQKSPKKPKKHPGVTTLTERLRQERGLRVHPQLLQPARLRDAAGRVRGFEGGGGRGAAGVRAAAARHDGAPRAPCAPGVHEPAGGGAFERAGRTDAAARRRARGGAAPVESN
jgi:hypothetical protein